MHVNPTNDTLAIAIVLTNMLGDNAEESSVDDDKLNF